MLMALAMKRARERKMLYNMSAGAASFKRNRGCIAALEYSAVYNAGLAPTPVGGASGPETYCNGSAFPFCGALSYDGPASSWYAVALSRTVGSKPHRVLIAASHLSSFDQATPCVASPTVARTASHRCRGPGDRGPSSVPITAGGSTEAAAAAACPGCWSRRRTSPCPRMPFASQWPDLYLAGSQRGEPYPGVLSGPGTVAASSKTGFARRLSTSPRISSTPPTPISPTAASCAG